MFEEMNMTEMEVTNGGGIGAAVTILAIVLLAGSLSSCANSCDK